MFYSNIFGFIKNVLLLTVWFTGPEYQMYVDNNSMMLLSLFYINE